MFGASLNRQCLTMSFDGWRFEFSLRAGNATQPVATMRHLPFKYELQEEIALNWAS